MLKQIRRFLLSPSPNRAVMKALMKRFEWGSYAERLEVGAVDRPHYGHCLYTAALHAQRLGVDRISAIEFGCAGGNGLVSLELHAAEVKRALGVTIDVYGFDTGVGLPVPVDYTYNPAPVGAIFVDVDTYTSTVSALKLFDGDDAYFMPRIFAYFDDVIGSENQLFCEYTGELLAIDEFNDQHETRKIAGAHYLLSSDVLETWHHCIRVYHHFDHPRYNDSISKAFGQSMPLR